MKNSNANLRYQKIKKSLMPFCKKVECVGDLRRHCPDVKAIEILAISRVADVNSLFGGDVAPYSLVEDWVLGCGLDMVINTPEYKQFVLEGMNVELYLTNAYRWGLQMALRTGCEAFSEWLMTNQAKGGALPDDMRIMNGWLYAGDKKLITMTEQNFFTCIETEWIRPSQRSARRVLPKGNWRK
ncbi:hypothetical protein [Vibrio sp.]|uniref:hypothetical protein n=1 Tax=Vibrio sp. TaxID=678 RepID=UPI003D0E9636